jgi:large subunit ribosomal protein L24
MKMKIARNDIVEVIAGDGKGKRGRVLRVQRGDNRVVIEKVHLVKRHQRPSGASAQGGIVEKEAPIHASNVRVVERGQNRGAAAKEPKAAKQSKRGKRTEKAQQE